MKRTILITGASSGIGKAAAKHFARNGWNVVATMRRPADVTDLRQVRMFTAEEVAQVILSAATDTTGKLRYLAGDDARGFIKARREMTENDYATFMRSKLLQTA